MLRAMVWILSRASVVVALLCPVVLALSIPAEEPPRTLIQRVEVAPDGRNVRFENLPPKVLQAHLKVQQWTFVETVSLEEGEDQTVVFRPQFFTVSGTVYRGGEPHPAQVSLGIGGGDDVSAAVTETDDEGFYELSLIQPGVYVSRVRLRDARGEPFLKPVDLLDAADVTIDFRVPANAFTLRVLDAVTGTGVAGADVSIANQFDVSYVEKDDGMRATKAAQSGVTDAEGLFSLPPLRPGKLEIYARANGYKRSHKSLPVEEDDREMEFVLELVPETEMHGLRLSLPQGEPAAAAEIAAFRSVQGEFLWIGSADEDGEVDVPDALKDTSLLVRHPQAGVLLRSWNPGSSLVTWTLPPAAPVLTLLAKRSWGDPAAWARFALWIDGVVLTGLPLAWLAQPPFSDADGFWRVANLPAAPLKVLAWVPDSEPPGVHEALATAVPFPWTDVVEIEVVE